MNRGDKVNIRSWNLLGECKDRNGTVLAIVKDLNGNDRAVCELQDGEFVVLLVNVFHMTYQGVYNN